MGLRRGLRLFVGCGRDVPLRPLAVTLNDHSHCFHHRKGDDMGKLLGTEFSGVDVPGVQDLPFRIFHREIEGAPASFYAQHPAMLTLGRGEFNYLPHGNAGGCQSQGERFHQRRNQSLRCAYCVNSQPVPWEICDGPPFACVRGG